jgi:hypothetical protein
MKVAELQSFIRSLGQALAASGAKQVSADLERACSGLEPFRELPVAQFADFLAQAETYARTGVVAADAKSKGRSKGVDREKVKGAAQRILALYERASDVELQYSAIESEIKSLDGRMSKDEVLELAREIGIVGTLKTKKDALERIKRKVAERKQSFERVQF